MAVDGHVLELVAVFNGVAVLCVVLYPEPHHVHVQAGALESLRSGHDGRREEKLGAYAHGLVGVLVQLREVVAAPARHGDENRGRNRSKQHSYLHRFLVGSGAQKLGITDTEKPKLLADGNWPHS